MPLRSTLPRLRTNRCGLTLPELLIASSIMAMMIVTLSTLAFAVNSGHEYSQGRSIATQHARVAVERLSRNLNNAHATAEFPGFVAIREVVGAYSFPDTLVVWSPDGAPANPQGLPLVGELVVYCPNPSQPFELWEMTAAGDPRTVPALIDTTQWAALLAWFKQADSVTRVEVTDLLRTGSVTNGSDSTVTRGVVRFEVTLRPSDQQLQSFADGDLAWNEIDWVQGIHGETTGLRQAWCSVELQLMPGNWSAAEDPGHTLAIPFFTSGAVYYQVSQ